MVLKSQIKKAKNCAECKPKNTPNPKFTAKKTPPVVRGGNIKGGAADYMDESSKNTTPKLLTSGQPRLSVKARKGNSPKASMASKVASGNKKPFGNGLKTDVATRYEQRKKIGL